MSQNHNDNKERCSGCSKIKSLRSTNELWAENTYLDSTPYARIVAKNQLLKRPTCPGNEGCNSGGDKSHLCIGIVSLSANNGASNFMNIGNERLVAVTPGGRDTLCVTSVRTEKPESLPDRNTEIIVGHNTTKNLLENALMDHRGLELIVILETGTPCVWPENVELHQGSPSPGGGSEALVKYKRHNDRREGMSAKGTTGLVVYKRLQPVRERNTGVLDVNLITVQDPNATNPANSTRPFVLVSYILERKEGTNEIEEEEEDPVRYVEYVGHLPNNLNGNGNEKQKRARRDRYLQALKDAGREHYGGQPLIHLAFHGDTNWGKSTIKDEIKQKRTLDLTLSDTNKHYTQLPALWGGFVASGGALSAYVCDSGGDASNHKYYMSSIELASDSEGDWVANRRAVAFPSVASALGGSIRLPEITKSNSMPNGFVYCFDHISMVTHTMTLPCAHYVSPRRMSPAYCGSLQKRESLIDCGAESGEGLAIEEE